MLGASHGLAGSTFGAGQRAFPSRRDSDAAAQEGRKEGRRLGDRSVAALATAFALGQSATTTAQGTWTAPFQHNEPYNGNGNFTHPYVPWDFELAGALPPGTAIEPPAGMNVFLGWPDAPAGVRKFNAVHMSVIPKGPYRGHVLVWNVEPVLAKNPSWVTPAQGHHDYMSFQPYAIIDPGESLPANGVRYRNFLLPLGEYDPLANPAGQNLFCSGHTWTEHGDLVVVGGTDFFTTAGVFYNGARVTMVCNPRLDVATYPGTAINPYPGLFGMWRRGPDLQSKRWYPTATRTLRLPRLANLAHPQGRETILTLGGSNDDGSDDYLDNPTWNNYEALVVNAEATSGNPGLATDQVFDATLSVFVKEWNGPGTYVGGVPQLEVDWFEEYPRCHPLSTRQILMSGYAPRWALLDHESPGVWIRSPGQTTGSTVYSSNWQHFRHDGSSVLFPNLGGGINDTVLRLGGSDEHWYTPPPASVATTPTVEQVRVASSDAWQAVSAMPSTHPPGSMKDGGRYLMNTVLLPTGGVLVLGGVHRDVTGSTFVLKPQMFENGTWDTYDKNTMLGDSPRDYHSTAVLLPDGRVFVGGGNQRIYDYEIWSPPYLDKPEDRPQNVDWVAPAPLFDSLFDAHVLERDAAYELACDRLAFGHRIEKVVLMAPCSVTHHSDMHQRYVEMTTERLLSANHILMRVPASEGEVPNGIYMLFVVTSAPSVSQARWVVIR
jgi:hypothetical protein